MKRAMIYSMVTCAAASPTRADDEARLRADILTSLDPAVAPSGTTQVALQFKLFKILKVDMPQGQVTIKAWRRLTWRDTRLAWDPTKYNGLTSSTFFPRGLHAGTSDVLDSRMWVPDLYLYNSITPLDQGFGSAGAAYIDSDGSVFYSVPGIIDASCRFTGLVNFPYDKLSCPLEFGSWAYGDMVMNLSYFENGGAQLAWEESGGASYQEYKLTDLPACTRTTATYPCCPNESWSTLNVRVYLSRPAFYYHLMVETPGWVLTLLSCAVFWLDTARCGERIGYGVTLLLAIEVSKVVIQELLPICGELLWVELFLKVNWAFCVLALLETLLVSHLAFTEREGDAARLDWWARRLILPAYFICMGTVYSTNLEDGYLGSAAEMFEGIRQANITASCIAAPLVVALFAVSISSYHKWQRRKVPPRTEVSHL